MAKIKQKITRVATSKEETKKSYDKMSRWYDIMASSEEKFTKIGLEKLNVQPGEIILEIGFGTGHSIVSIAKALGKLGKVYGIDISEGMYDMTRSRVAAAALSNRVKLILGDALKLPFEDKFFNGILMSHTLELFDTPEMIPLLTECKRVLKSGGRLCTVSLLKKESIMVKLYEFAHKLFPKFIDCRPIYVREILREAGFRISTAREMSMWGLPVDIVVGKKD